MDEKIEISFGAEKAEIVFIPPSKILDELLLPDGILLVGEIHGDRKAEEFLLQASRQMIKLYGGGTVILEFPRILQKYWDESVLAGEINPIIEEQIAASTKSPNFAFKLRELLTFQKLNSKFKVFFGDNKWNKTETFHPTGEEVSQLFFYAETALDSSGTRIWGFDDFTSKLAILKFRTTHLPVVVFAGNAHLAKAAPATELGPREWLSTGSLINREGLPTRAICQIPADRLNRIGIDETTLIESSFGLLTRDNKAILNRLEPSGFFRTGVWANNFDAIIFNRR